jgi:xylulokinase
MNLKVDTVEVEEGPAYGGAILAAVANGAFPDVEHAVASIVRIKDTTESDEALVQKYESCYQKFVKMYPALKETFQTLV